MYSTYANMIVKPTWRLFIKDSTWDYIMFQCHMADWTGFTSMDALGKTCDEYIKTYGAAGKGFRDLQENDIADLKDDSVMSNKLDALKRLFSNYIVSAGTSTYQSTNVRHTKLDASYIDSWERFYDAYKYFVYDKLSTKIGIPTETVTTSDDRDTQKDTAQLTIL